MFEPGAVDAAPSPRSPPARYSIRVAALMTATPQGTLRVWERRYAFPRPLRTRGGRRSYSESDVAALKLIRRALDHGYRAGDVVGKSPAELARLAMPDAPAAPASTAAAPTLDALARAVSRDDVEGIRAGLRRAALVFGPRAFVVDVVHPLCVRVGELWASGALEVRHEHVLTACLSAQLRVLSAAYDERGDGPCVLLAALPGERHGLGLEVLQVYLAAEGARPILLGVETPADQIAAAARALSADAVGLRVTPAADPGEAVRGVAALRASLARGVPLLWGGGARLDGLPRAGVREVSTFADLDAALARLRRTSRGGAPPARR